MHRFVYLEFRILIKQKDLLNRQEGTKVRNKQKARKDFKKTRKQFIDQIQAVVGPSAVQAAKP